MKRLYQSNHKLMIIALPRGQLNLPSNKNDRSLWVHKSRRVIRKTQNKQTNDQTTHHTAATQRASPAVMEGISPDRCIRCIIIRPAHVKKKKKRKRGDNDPLTILTSDTISMLAMSIFIPTPTGGPGEGQENVKSCRIKAHKGNIWRHSWKSGKGVQMPQLSVG